MGKIAISTVRNSMERKRRNYLAKAKTPKEVKFGQDLEVLTFAVNHYYDQYNAYHGNYPSLSETSYNDYHDMIAYKGDYDMMMEILLDDYDNAKAPETKALIQLARKLRKRYGGRRG